MIALPGCAIGIMTKTPRAGESKTRLCPPLTPEQAAILSGAFLRDTTENILAAARSVSIAGYAAYAPRGSEPLLRPSLADGVGCLLADGSIPVPANVVALGRCLLHAMQAMFALGHSAACVLSADTPTLPTAILATAAELLLSDAERRIVFGACEDGGYYLLGTRQVHAGLFADIPWSTEGVADATRRRAKSLGLELVEMPLWYDVDDPVALLRTLRDVDGYAAPWSKAAIRAIDPGRSLMTLGTV